MALSENDCLYIVKTLAHAATLVGELLAGLKSHAKILISSTISNPRHTLEKINEYEVTTICVNPTLLRLYTLTANTKKMSFDCLKTIYTSGAIAEVKLLEKAQETFCRTEILNVYGLSEAGPRVSAQMRGKNNVIGSVGKPLRSIDVAVVSNDGKPVAAMEKGIIHVNTPTIGSHNVYPEEIEAFIMKFSDIRDCIIISLKNDIYESKMVCFYEADADISHDLRKLCLNNLAPYEIPSEVFAPFLLDYDFRIIYAVFRLVFDRCRFSAGFLYHWLLWFYWLL